MSGLGAAAPALAVAMPLAIQGALLGVVETATFRAFDAREQALLDGAHAAQDFESLVRVQEGALDVVHIPEHGLVPDVLALAAVMSGGAGGIAWCC